MTGARRFPQRVMRTRELPPFFEIIFMPAAEDMREAEPRAARRLILKGNVQGLGVRPVLFRLATSLGLGGCVRNTARGVEIDLEGSTVSLQQFVERLPQQLPEAARLQKMEVLPGTVRGEQTFTIHQEPSEGPLGAGVPPDYAVCPQCLAEVADAQDRRHRYPFTSCTLCGPRYSIIESMPYERFDTTMDRFEFCDACRQEYERPGDRRFHAQTNACPRCGPNVWCVDSEGRDCGRGPEALQRAIQVLRAGKIVALRGVGGYQLLVDATDEDAVERLRSRKGRRAKPLAVLVDSLATALRCAELDAIEQSTLCSVANPIVVCRARPDHGLASGIHPDLNRVGLMLPSTPLHALIAQGVGRPLVCTSGNREGDPLEYTVERAQASLAGLCDLWLHHDREIRRPIDDSVVQVVAQQCVTIRLARGLAPLPLDLPAPVPTLALGGHLKCAVAWSNGAQAVLGPHVGDQEHVSERERLVDQLESWQRLYRFQPQQLIHDLHPDYFTTRWAAEQSLPRRAVQHHHAHVVAGMLQRGWLDRTVLGVAWDGTGYGPDQVIWGGEFLVAEAGRFQRIAHLRPFRLPGGEAAILQPWRCCLAILDDAVGPAAADRFLPGIVDPQQRTLLRQILAHPERSPVTTSAGRLFDAAAVLCLATDHAAFDGQLAMRLEALADPTAEGQYRFAFQRSDVSQLDWRPLMRDLCDDLLRGTPPSTIAMRFHRTIAAGIFQVCQSRADLPVVFSGGVFQNRLLTELLVEMFSFSASDCRQPVAWPGIIPPGDGGLAAGQLATCAAKGENH